MQCTYPLYSTGCPDFGRDYPRCPPLNYNSTLPNIIGEGEVASVVFPDGSIHFYFLPNKRLPEPIYNLNFPNYNPYSNNMTTNGAYYVRSISNPMSQAEFNQHCQIMHGLPYSKPILNMPCPAYQLKFHNDSWSSTTDLSHFCPRKREFEWPSKTLPKYSASIQVDTPAVTDCPAVCAKPCLCSHSNDAKQSNKCREIDMTEYCECDKQSETSLTSNESTGKLKKRKSKTKFKKQRKAQKKSSSHGRKPDTKEKSVTTYTDQSTCCCLAEESYNTQTDNSLNTQACCGTSVSGSHVRSRDKRKDVPTELWYPKSSGSRDYAKSSEKIIGVCNSFSTTASESCCCSLTDSERHIVP